MKQQRRSTLLEDTPTHVLATQDVPSGFVEAQLKMAQSIAGVSSLEVEGFVMSESHHHSLYRMLQFMLFSTDKDWKSVQFVDTISHHEFTKWRAAKEKLMREAERYPEFEKGQWINGRLSWNVTITIPSTVDLREIVKQIKKDNDIFEVTVNQARECVILHLFCGWSPRTTSTKLVLRSYLSKSTRRVGQKQRMSDRSDASLSISASSLATFGSSRSGSIKRQRKRANRMSRNETSLRETPPDYNWKDGSYYRNYGADYDWEVGSYTAKSAKEQ